MKFLLQTVVVAAMLFSVPALQATGIVRLDVVNRAFITQLQTQQIPQVFGQLDGDYFVQQFFNAGVEFSQE